MKKILLCILSIFIIFLLYLLYPAPQNINDPIDSAIYLSIGKNIQNAAKQLLAQNPSPEPIVVQNKLDIPQIVQETNIYCVPACIQMTLRYHNIEANQEDLAEQLRTSSVTGTEYIDMARVLNTYLFHKETLSDDQESGYRIQNINCNETSEEVSNIFQKRVERNIQDGYPVFAAINLHSLYPSLPSANHMVVVNGYIKENEEISSYYVIDPYGPVQDPVYGGQKIFTSDELLQAILENEEPAYIW